VRIKVATVVDAPIARVWDELEQIERHPEWMHDAVAIKFLGGSTRGVGTEFECVTKVGPFRTTDVMRVVEWQPKRTMAIEHRGAVTGAGAFVLSKRRRATRFVWREKLSFPWWLGGRAGEQLARPILKRVWRRNLAAFKAQVEGKA
jgi:hypothetical protein